MGQCHLEPGISLEPTYEGIEQEHVFGMVLAEYGDGIVNGFVQRRRRYHLGGQMAALGETLAEDLGMDLVETEDGCRIMD